MQVKVTKDEVKIIDEDYILNKGEYKVNKCYFEFSEEYTDNLVKKAIFVNGDLKKEMVISNNQCNIPYEVLVLDNFELRVYAYEISGDDIILRYSPTYTNVYLRAGSYISGATGGEEITPTQFEQYQQALNEGLVEVNSKLEDVDTAIVETNNLDITVSKFNRITTVALTKKDSTTQTVQILDGQQGEQGEQGETGQRGPKGDPGKDGAIQYMTGENVTIEDNTISVDLSSRLNIDKVKSTHSTTSGAVYDVTYINNTIGDIDSLLGGI